MSQRVEERYDVALSYAGEDRAVARELAHLISALGCSIFFDESQQAKLWGKDLYQHLSYIYKDSAKYCIVFVSKSYAKKLWTRHELRQAQARAFAESREYILPLQLDDTKLPGLPETTGYIDLRLTPVEEVAALVLQKLAEQEIAHPSLPLDSIYRSENQQHSFEHHCETLKSLASSSARLHVTLVAMNGSEDLFFVPPAVGWFAYHKRLVESGSLAVERILFFDMTRFNSDAAYRWKFWRIYHFLVEFTKPIFNVVGVDTSSGTYPIDLQIFHTQDGQKVLIIPVVEASIIMQPEVVYKRIEENDAPDLFSRVEVIFSEYLKLKDYSKFLKDYENGIRSNESGITIPEQLSKL